LRQRLTSIFRQPPPRLAIVAAALAMVVVGDATFAKLSFRVWCISPRPGV